MHLQAELDILKVSKMVLCNIYKKKSLALVGLRADDAQKLLLILNEILREEKPERGHYSQVWTVKSCCTIQTLTPGFKPGTVGLWSRNRSQYTIRLVSM